MNIKKNIIVIGGATASGKSSAALGVCRTLGGELVSCDSMQIYRKMDIGTAKPTREEMAIVPHHMINIKHPKEGFSSADYASLAKASINDILSRGKLPVVCGGTGLYLDSLMFINQRSQSACDNELRQRLLNNDKHENWLTLQKIDPQSAEKIHENNVIRVVRALEIYYLTGKTKTENDKMQISYSDEYNYQIFVLSYKNRDILYDRINLRVDQMLEQGLVNEIRGLLDSGDLIEGTTAYQAIGYKEMIAYINGAVSYDQAVNDLKQATRNYAKRQITWFSRYKNATFVYADEFANSEQIVDHIVQCIKKKGDSVG